MLQAWMPRKAHLLIQSFAGVSSSCRWSALLGFNVPDVAATVKALRENGVIFNTYQHVSELGIWTAPGGTVHVAWFKDPDGNVLSVTNA
jgi:hypothetical protein